MDAILIKRTLMMNKLTLISNLVTRLTPIACRVLIEFVPLMSELLTRTVVRNDQ